MSESKDKKIGFIVIKDNIIFHQAIQNIDSQSQKQKNKEFEECLEERCKASLSTQIKVK